MSHDYSPPRGEFQPPDIDIQEQDDDDQISGAIRILATLDLEEGFGQDAAFAVIDRLMNRAYAEGRKDAVEAAEVDRCLSVVGTVVRHYPGNTVSMSTLIPPDELVHGMQLLAYRR
jgi:hypothetical protein